MYIILCLSHLPNDSRTIIKHAATMVVPEIQVLFEQVQDLYLHPKTKEKRYKSNAKI